jgi:acetylornithine/LysW-gamma-L-lysine aminotransferase
VIEVMAEEKLAERAAALGSWLKQELEQLGAAQIRDIRGLGLMLGLELRSKVTPILKTMMTRGVWALPAGLNVLRLLPPLVIEQPDLEQVVAVLDEVLA